MPEFLHEAKLKKAVFDSEASRFEKTRERSPGPAKYEPTEPVYILSGTKEAVFGSQAERDSMLQRDLLNSPFKNPTHLDNPSPDTYQGAKMDLDTRRQMAQTVDPLKDV